MSSKGITQFHNGTPVLGNILDNASKVMLEDGRTLQVGFDALNGQIDVVSHEHNKIFRGKDITANYDSGKFSQAIADGTFDDIYIGDYIKKTITVEGNTYEDIAYVAHIDPFYAGYNSYANVAEHHVALVHVSGLTHNMNASNTTAGGYVGSAMHTWLNNTVLPALKTAFGSAHFLTHQKLYSNAVNTSGISRYGSGNGCSSSWAWSTNQAISLLTEHQVYGGIAWSSSGYDTGEAYQQLAIFALKRPNQIFGNRHVWLRDVASATNFCILHYDGNASNGGASSVLSACPLTLSK